MMNWEMLSVFIVVFVGVTILAFRAARWRQGDLNRLQEWGLAGRRFGTIVTWCLLGGDIYTAYTLIALPGFVFAVGATRFLCHSLCHYRSMYSSFWYAQVLDSCSSQRVCDSC